MKTKAYVFIAGGIGITPFRSIMADLIAKEQQKKITLFYFVSDAKDILFPDILDKAAKIGIQVLYFLTPKDGHLTAALLQKNVPDWQEREYYISGPQAMVEEYRDILMQEGISEEKIKVDLFTGY